MASTVLELGLPSGLTLTVSLFPLTSDTAVASAKTLTEATNAKGWYTATITEALSGKLRFVVFSGSTVISKGLTHLEDDTGTWREITEADVKTISEDRAAADNLEAALDGTGYDIGGIDVSVLNTAATAIGSDGTGLTEAGGTGDHLTAITNAIDAVDNFIDTEVAAIVSAIGTPSDLGSGATLADNLSDIDAQHASDIIYDNIAVSAGTNTAVFTVATSEGIPATSNALTHATVEVISGTGADTQPRRVVLYTVSAGTATFTVEHAMLTTLDNTSVIRIRRGTTVAASTVTGNVQGNVSGNVLGSVGSVAGTVSGTVGGVVGSMVGNITGNLSGSVGSVLGGINTTAGTITTLDALDTAQDSQHATTQAAIDAVDNFVDTEIAAIISALATAQADLDIITGTAGALIDAGTGTGQLSISSGLLAWNSAWDAEVQSEANDALVALGLDHLISASVTGTDVADNSIIAKMVSKSATADWDTFNNTTDALEILRDSITSIASSLTTIDTKIGSPSSLGSGATLSFNMTDIGGKVDAVDNFIDTEVAAIVSAIGTPSDLGSGATLAFNLADIEGQTDDIGAAGAGLSAIPQLSSALTEAYRSDGATGTLAQILYELIAHMGERSISGTTMTLKKLDGSTTAATFSLDDADAPTSITRAS